MLGLANAQAGMQQALATCCTWLPHAFVICCLSQAALGQISGPKARPGLHRCCQGNIQGMCSCPATANKAWHPHNQRVRPTVSDTAHSIRRESCLAASMAVRVACSCML